MILGIVFILAFLLFVLSSESRKLLLALLPFGVFALVYDSLRYFPNYEFNSIDVKSLYDLELSLFGVPDGGGLVIPSAFCQNHHKTVLDVLAGMFYLCWVPVPIFYAVYLFCSGRRNWSIRLSMCFLLVNLLGFVGYYVHPASPPWYVLQHGFEPIIGTPGCTAGLGYFDQIIGLPVFASLYGANSNVFAAIPSLHATYTLVTTYYAYRAGARKYTIAIFALITLGIWCTAVYSAHHYIIDVILGILTATIGVFIFEKVIMKTSLFKRFYSKYCNIIG